MSNKNNQNIEDLPEKEPESLKKKIGKYAFLLLMIVGAIGFVFGDIEQYTGGGSPNSILAKVGNKKITLRDANEIQQIINEQNRHLPENLVNLINTPQNTLERLINSSALSEYAREFGIRGNNQKMKNVISNINYLQDGITGEFSRERLEQYLDATGQTEDEFLYSIEDDIIRKIITPKIITTVIIPDELVNIHQTYATQQRKISYIAIDKNILDIENKKITEEERKSYFEKYKNSPKFLRPETRDISYITFSAESLKQQLGITDKNIKDFYNNNKDKFSTPERRKVLQLFFKDKKSADETYNKIDLKENFIISATELGFALEDIDLGIVSKGDALPDEVFTLKKGGISKVLENDFGFGIYYVEDIETSKNNSFKDVRKKIENNMIKSAFNRFKDDNIDIIEDEIAGGASLKEISDKYSLKINSYNNITQEGNIFGDSNQSILDSSLSEHFFDINPEDGISFISIGNGFIYGEVNSITEKRGMSIKEAASLLEKSYKESKIKDGISNLYKQISEFIDQGMSINEIAKKIDTKSKTKIMSRYDKLSNISKEDITKIFSINHKDLNKQKPFISTYTPNIDSKFVVLNLNEILESDKDELQHVAIEKNIKKQILQESYNATLDGIKENINIDINDKLYSSFVNYKGVSR